MKKKEVSENLIENEKKRSDLGFGSKVVSTTTRLVQQDGSFNVRRKGQSFKAWLNAYNRAITMGWIRFTALIFGFYVIVNFAFAWLYVWLGTENLQGIIGSSFHDRFWDAFFFSSQTLTTVGYGRVAPISFGTGVLSSLESLLGLMIFALITGILYGRFSRPKPYILFSKNALIAPYFDSNAFMFRIVNEKSNQIINVKVSIVMSRIEDTNGLPQRKYYNLSLERDFVNFFPTNWTIVHPITPESPLWGETPQSFAATDTEFLIAIEGREDTFAEAIHTRSSYLHNDIVWGAKFKPMLEENGHEMLLNLKAIDDYQKVPLN